MGCCTKSVITYGRKNNGNSIHTKEIDKNLNISQINVTNGSLTTEFDNETNEYTIKVEDDNVNLNVVPESTFTTVSGDGNMSERKLSAQYKNTSTVTVVFGST